MSVEKELFLIDIGHDVIDLGEIEAADWQHIKHLAKDLIQAKQITEVSKAYIGAFIMWLDIQRSMRRPFNGKHDMMN